MRLIGGEVMKDFKTVFVAATQENKMLESIISIIDNTLCYKVIGYASTQKELFKKVMQTAIERFDILFYVEGIEGDSSSIDFLNSFKRTYQDVRVIYVTSNADMKEASTIIGLNSLIDNGIYDIFHGSSITKTDIVDLLKNHKTIEDNQTIRVLNMRVQKKGEATEAIKANISGTYVEERDSQPIITQGYDNVVVVSSIKPGTGKSFISTNIATAIAKYGTPKKNHRKPTVALIEGDLQTLSVGTLLRIQDDDYNLRTALDKVATVIDDTGNDIGSREQHMEVKRFIKRCFLPYSSVPNLFVLAGSQISFSEWNNINPYQYFYLLESVVDEFDVIIVDSNSSLEHKTTGPILQLANTCFYVIDLDYNNIRMNMRYRQILNQLGLASKVKYILNKNIEDFSRFEERLDYSDEALSQDFDIVGKIPIIDNTVVLNRLTAGKPVILDDSKETLYARIAITNIVKKEIWDMDNTYALQIEKDMIENPKKSKTKKRFRFFRK